MLAVDEHASARQERLERLERLEQEDLEDPETKRMPPPRATSAQREQGRRRTLALSAYAAFVLVCFAVLLRHGLRLSDEYAIVEPGVPGLPGLRRGYLPFGVPPSRRRLVDLSDVQWRGFRESMVPLTIVFGVFAGVSRLIASSSGGNNNNNSKKAAAEANYAHRVRWIVVSGVGFLLYLHGRCALYVYGLVSASWVLTRWVRRTGWPSWAKTAAVWAWHVGVLMVVKESDGFLTIERGGGVAGRVLRGLGVLGLGRGVFRWEICYNMTMLRLVSQSLDILWEDASGMPTAAGSYWVAVAHAVYPPLYLAGPIVTYTDFAGQISSSPGTVDTDADSYTDTGDAPAPAPERARRKQTRWRELRVYGLRTALDVAVIELMSHYLYFNSIATNNVLTANTNTRARNVSALDVATCGWWALAFTWLKFCVIWRFFRLAALLEGITPPENMRKCFAMNYDVQGFWKNWHASFNRWLVKYMYIPAGARGGTAQLLMVWPIFVFVALWHDVEIRLLGWAGLMILAFMPELLVKREFARSRWDWVRRDHPTALWVAKALAATVTISSLMVGNMVGFVVGLDGAGAFLRQLSGSGSLVAASLVSFFCAASIMLETEDWLYAK